MLRLMVASDTCMPISSSNASRCSLKVRSGLDPNCLGSHSLKAAPFTEGLPGDLAGADISGVAPSDQPAVYGREGDPEELHDFSFLGMPRSTAASTLNLRSFE
jgi:hypothetical protein